ncbi:hypothetical protein GCM10012275_11410 [Longimycelium tulufanense]|uniref:Saccharopine dehydrogenase NADP binding domain-containing protein n=1 Tax=Longimycelium tulufanense TaxID=907463 RepID=A0A8J3CA24_9PSEU|nr:hypothetical protein GCM10012275_11410 [Longimycelium tulufanense]
MLLGATGHTGRLTAEALARAGSRPLLVGRDPHKLTGLATSLDGETETAVVDVTSTEGELALRDLLAPGDVLVSTVGPFLKYGETAVRAATETGAKYLDSTGEPPFVRTVFTRFGPLAERSGAGLVTAFGYDYVPGNLAAELALRRADPERARRVEIGYFMTNIKGRAFSRGTMVSLAGVLGETSYTFADGQLRDEPPAQRVADFPAGDRVRQAVSIGASEHFALPAAHPNLVDVDVYLGWFGKSTRSVSQASRIGAKVPVLTTAASRIAGMVASRLPEAPDPRSELASAAVVAIVRSGDGQRLAEVELRGASPYRFTAEMLAWGARKALEGGMSGTGALGPVAAFGLDELEAGCAQAGLRQHRAES